MKKKIDWDKAMENAKKRIDAINKVLVQSQKLDPKKMNTPVGV